MARRDALLRLHKTLLGRHAALRKALAGELADLRKLTVDASGDSADVAFDTGSDEISSQLAELEARELNQIERALMRIKHKTYGLCEACSGKISILRLNALPYCTLCINCQREMEQDANWMEAHSGSWDRVSDDADEPREIDLTDLEMDFSK